MNSKNLKIGELVTVTNHPDGMLYFVVDEDGFTIEIIPSVARPNERTQITDISLLHRPTIRQKNAWLASAPWFDMARGMRDGERLFYFRSPIPAEAFRLIVGGSPVLETTPGAIWRVSAKWAPANIAA